MGRYYVALGTIAMAVALLIAPAHSIDKGTQAPAFSLQSLDGRQVTLDELKGKVVYLDFWASWCGPCRFSLPFMNKLVDKFSRAGLVVLAVNIDSDRAKAEKALSSFNAKYTVLLDPHSTLPAIYNPPKMPTSFVIGRTGVVTAVHEGFNPNDTGEIDSAIEKALTEK